MIKINLPWKQLQITLKILKDSLDLCLNKDSFYLSVSTLYHWFSIHIMYCYYRLFYFIYRFIFWFFNFPPKTQNIVGALLYVFVVLFSFCVSHYYRKKLMKSLRIIPTPIAMLCIFIGPFSKYVSWEEEWSRLRKQ